MMAAEKNYENKIKRFLRERGAWFVKYFGGGIYTKAGVPDILCCIHGRFLGIEVKAEHGRPSEIQLHTIEQIRRAGGYAFVLYPKDWKLFQSAVENLIDGKVFRADREFREIGK